MRVSRFLLLAPACVAACALPERRPDANAIISDCDTGFEVGGLINHASCLALDATASHVYIGGAASYRWTAEVTGAAEPLVLGTSAVVSGARFFQNFPIEGTQARVLLTVTDSKGNDRTFEKSLYLTNDPPSIQARDALIARTTSLERLPFLVVRANASDPDGDELATVVTQIDGEPLVGYACSEVPTLTPFPDPAPGEPAWCYELVPITAAPSYPDRLASRQPEAFRFRIEVYERYGLAPEPASGCNGDNVACSKYQLTTTAWATTGFGTEATRVASGWQRRPGVEAAGRAIEKAVNRTWVPIAPGTGLGANGMQAFAGGLGGDVSSGTGSILGGFAPGQPGILLEGLGSIADVKSGRGVVGGMARDGLWVAALATGTASNPGALATPVPFTVPPGEIYLVFVPDTHLGASENLATAQPADFRFVTGFGDPGNTLLGFENPYTFESTATGDLWVATRDSFTLVDNLRFLPASDATEPRNIKAQTDFAAGTITWGVLYDVNNPGVEPPLDFLSPSGTDMWVVALDPGKLLGSAYRFTTGGLQVEAISVEPPMPPGGTVNQNYPEHVLYDAASQSLWVISSTYNSQTGGISRTLLRADAGGVDVVAAFGRPTEITLDAAGGLWVDEILSETFGSVERRLSYLEAGAAPTGGQWPFLMSQPFRANSVGIVASGSAVEVADFGGLARVPANEINEIAVRTEVPLYNSIAGVDARDGAAFLSARLFSAPGAALTRVDALTGEALPILLHSSASILVATALPPIRAFGADAVTPGAIWVSTSVVVGSNVEMVQTGRLSLASVDALAAEGGFREWSTIPVCDGVVPVPCWETLRAPDDRWVMAMTYSPVEDRVYALLDEDAIVGGPARLASFAAYGDGTRDATSSPVAVGAATALLDAPLTPFVRKNGAAWDGGVWLTQVGHAARWSTTGTAITEDATFRIETGDPQSAPASVQIEPTTGKIWVAYRSDISGAGGVAAYDAVDMPVTNGAAVIDLPAAVVGPVPFENALWTTSFYLTRVVANGNNVRLDYSGAGADLNTPMSVWAGAPY